MGMYIFIGLPVRFHISCHKIVADQVRTPAHPMHLLSLKNFCYPSKIYEHLVESKDALTKQQSQVSTNIRNERVEVINYILKNYLIMIRFTKS